MDGRPTPALTDAYQEVQGPTGSACMGTIYNGKATPSISAEDIGSVGGPALTAESGCAIAKGCTKQDAFDDIKNDR